MKSCGSCGQFHPKGFDGDCRDDANDPTIVVFRKWPEWASIGKHREVNCVSGGIIALFPEVPGSPGFCSSYEHIGQHGSADYGYVISKTTPATPEEYAGLKRELESKPFEYVLRAVKRRKNPWSR